MAKKKSSKELDQTLYEGKGDKEFGQPHHGHGEEAVEKKYTLRELAKITDDMFTIREKRYAQQHVVDALKKQEADLEKILIDNLSTSQATSVAGQIAISTVKKSTVPTVTDWDEVWKYIVKKKAYDLLQRRLSMTAVEERWGSGEAVSGVGKLQVKKISLTKVKK